MDRKGPVNVKIEDTPVESKLSIPPLCPVSPTQGEATMPTGKCHGNWNSSLPCLCIFTNVFYFVANRNTVMVAVPTGKCHGCVMATGTSDYDACAYLPIFFLLCCKQEHSNGCCVACQH